MLIGVYFIGIVELAFAVNLQPKVAIMERPNFRRKVYAGLTPEIQLVPLTLPSPPLWVKCKQVYGQESQDTREHEKMYSNTKTSLR